MKEKKIKQEKESPRPPQNVSCNSQFYTTRSAQKKHDNYKSFLLLMEFDGFVNGEKGTINYCQGEITRVFGSISGGDMYAVPD